MRALGWGAALAALLASQAPRGAAAPITAELLRAHVRFLASDLLEGRGTATRGDALAEAYVAAQFEAAGLEPAGIDGGYQQPFEMVGVTTRPAQLIFTGAGKPIALEPLSDAMAVSGAPVEETRIAGAELVFVGYGIVAPEFKWNDFKDVDVTGKVLVVMNNDPEDDPALFGGKTRLWYGRWDYKYEQAARRGAAGALIIHTTPSAGYPWSVVQSSWSGELFSLPGSTAPRLPLKGWITEEAARRVFASGGKDLDGLRALAQRRDFHPVPLGVKVATELKSSIRRARTANVLGLLPGSDPHLSRTLVLYTAHYDHLGVRPSAGPSGDNIYNGAVDNAAGVAQLLAMVRAFTQGRERPRRSVLFAAVGAEEAGLLGSEYLAHHLPVPAADVALDINIDGANVFGRTRDVSVIGLGKTTVDAILGPLARAQGRTLKPDLRPDRGAFYRSDQFSFAKVGIPAAYFSSGLDYRGRPPGWGLAQQEAYVSQRYHQPSDELTGTWDLSGAVEDAGLYFSLGRAVANAPIAPRWTKGDEFERARGVIER